MAETALTLITDALLDLGVLADEETPTASQAVGGLRKLNNMIDAWSIENLLLFSAQSFTIPMVAGQGVYTIGPGGDVDVDRPLNVTSAYVRDTSLPITQQMDVPLYLYNNQEWQDVAFKSQQASYPNWGIWFDSGYPLVRAYMNPVPSSSQYSIVFWTSGPIGDLTLNQVISLPPGYKRGLVANLAIELAPSYGVQISPALAQIANDSKARLKIKNVQINELGSRMGGWYDIETGRYR